MTGNGIFKRLAPFFLTLLAGVFIASIFVDVSSPFGFRARRMQRWNDMQQIRIENDQLKRENECLRRQLGTRTVVRDDWTAPVPAPNMDPPPPPPAYRRAPRAISE